MDANGDGVGDFQGLMRRLDYLQGLGVTAIWLMPFQPSPCRDDGYDVADYYNVDPRYGTLGDFVEFTHGCKQRGMRVLIDLVVNHTSDQHPWFQEARRDPQSKYRDWYVWSKKKPPNAERRRGVSRRAEIHVDATTRTRSAYYFHRFYDFQPDLNTANPDVQAEILKIMGFWLQLGVVRFPHGCGSLRDRDERRRTSQAATSNTTCCARSASSCSGARATRSSSAKPTSCPRPIWSISATYGERLQMMFNFQVNQHLFYALASGDTRTADEGAESDQAAPGDGAMGRSSCAITTNSISAASRDEQRAAVFAAFGPDQTCSSTSAASGAGSRRCCKATAAGSNLPTA